MQFLIQIILWIFKKNFETVWKAHSNTVVLLFIVNSNLHLLKTLLIRSEHIICVYTIQWIHHCSWGFNFCQFLRSLLNTNLHPPKNKFKDMNCLKCSKNQSSYRYTKKLGLHKPVRLCPQTLTPMHSNDSTENMYMYTS